MLHRSFSNEILFETILILIVSSSLISVIFILKPTPSIDTIHLKLSKTSLRTPPCLQILWGNFVKKTFYWNRFLSQIQFSSNSLQSVTVQVTPPFMHFCTGGQTLEWFVQFQVTPSQIFQYLYRMAVIEISTNTPCGSFQNCFIQITWRNIQTNPGLAIPWIFRLVDLIGSPWHLK